MRFTCFILAQSILWDSLLFVLTKQLMEKYLLVASPQIDSPQRSLLAVENFYSSSSWIRLINKLAYAPIHLYQVIATEIIKVSTSSLIDRYCNFKGPTDASAILEKSSVTRYLLQRVILLDAKRISRSGKKLHQVRQKINVEKSLGMVTRPLAYCEVKEIFNEITFKRGWSKRFRDYAPLPDSDSEFKILGVGVYDIDSKQKSISVSIIPGELAKNVFCLTVEKGSSRWLATESMFALLYEHGVRVFSTGGLVGMDAGNFFQQNLGYLTRNIEYVA
jgi:hypothetical protein